MGSWIGWTAGLVAFDLLLIIIMVSFGGAGYDLGSSDYNSTVSEFSSGDTVEFSDLNWFDKFTVSFSSMPWWFDLFMITYNAVLVGLLIVAFVRGFS